MAKKEKKPKEPMAKKAKNEKTKKFAKSILAEFRAFISKGNILDLAVGVIIGGAFNAIVNAFTAILLSVCTWGVPGGLAGLVTVLPPATPSQRVPSDILIGGETLKQSYTASEWATLSQQDDFTATISGMYTKHGASYFYNGAAIIDWGAFINAIISFVIIALTLFVIVKVVKYAGKKRKELEEKAKEEYYKRHPEERPLPPVQEPAKPTQEELLTAILEELKKQNGAPAVEEKK